MTCVQSASENWLESPVGSCWITRLRVYLCRYGGVSIGICSDSMFNRSSSEMPCMELIRLGLLLAAHSAVQHHMDRVLIPLH